MPMETAQEERRMSERVAAISRSTPGVVTIGFGTHGAARETPARIGFKAANLLRMSHIGMPVPQAFVLDTEWVRALGRNEAGSAATALRDSLQAAVRDLEAATGLGFGSVRRPLLVSVRSGAAVSMPGMMETLLNIGLNDATVRALVRLTGNPRLAWNSYRRLIQSFAETVRGLDCEPFAQRVAGEVERQGLPSERMLDFASERALVDDFLELYRAIAREPFPQLPSAQLDAAVHAVIASADTDKAREYRKLHDLPVDLTTAVTVQRMVYGNAGGTSGAGVGFTRDPANGERVRYVDFLFNAQGEDVVSGRVYADEGERMATVLPDVSAQLDDIAARLEREFGDVQEFEFTVQDGELFLLQTRSAKRTPLAMLRSAVDMVDEGVLDPHGALAMLDHVDVDAIAVTRLDPSSGARAIARGVAAGVGVATGAIALDAAAAIRARDEGRRAILVRENAETADIDGIAAAAALVTIGGSRTSHAAVVARQLAKPCVVACAGVRVDLARREARFGDAVLREGDVVSVAADDATIFRGEVRIVSDRPDDLLSIVASWRAAARTARVGTIST